MPLKRLFKFEVKINDLLKTINYFIQNSANQVLQISIIHITSGGLRPIRKAIMLFHIETFSILMQYWRI